ncbi:MAG: hypothetical protein R2762_09025 [Bryobacteraceae bacterium]
MRTHTSASNQTPSQPPVQPLVQQELQFRLSLLKLLTVPHRSVPGGSPTAYDGQAAEASQRIEEMAVMVPQTRG